MIKTKDSNADIPITVDLLLHNASNEIYMMEELAEGDFGDGDKFEVFSLVPPMGIIVRGKCCRYFVDLNPVIQAALNKISIIEEEIS